jgi:hypothetical protein
MQSALTDEGESDKNWICEGEGEDLKDIKNYEFHNLALNTSTYTSMTSLPVQERKAVPLNFLNSYLQYMIFHTEIIFQSPKGYYIVRYCFSWKIRVIG